MLKSRFARKRLLDELCGVTCCERKHASKLLRGTLRLRNIQSGDEYVLTRRERPMSALSQEHNAASAKKTGLADKHSVWKTDAAHAAFCRDSSCCSGCGAAGIAHFRRAKRPNAFCRVLSTFIAGKASSASLHTANNTGIYRRIVHSHSRPSNLKCARG